MSVFDEGRLAREVLGHWFKHERFDSLVRQLNLYGFYKIPHHQQGVLRQEAEFSNYAHTHFHRDKPEMLCLVKRQKSGDVPSQIVEQNPLADAPAQRLTTDCESDITSIISELAAIKRQQATINTNLHSLQNVNQYLWREAMASRDRNKTQQCTIDRILEFLAEVYGPSGPPTIRDPNIAHTLPCPPQKLIGGAPGDEGNQSGVPSQICKLFSLSNLR